MAQPNYRNCLRSIVCQILCPVLGMVLLAPVFVWGQETAAEQGTVFNWPQWRGSGRDGILVGQPEWPGRLNRDNLQESWRVPLGESYSGPIVCGTMVYTTESKDKKQEIVRAFDRKSGQQVWETAWEGALSVPFFAKANGDWIRSTPACDGESLFVAGMRDVLVCLDLKTGAQRWRVDFVEKLSTAVPEFGFVCSPLVDGDFVYVQAGAAVCKLNKRDGTIVWRTLEDAGGMWGSAFSSPVFATLDGQRQLLVQTRQDLAAIDEETGAILWKQKIEAFRGMNILTPTVAGNSVFTSAYQGRSQLFSVSKSDAKPALSAGEVWSNRSRGYMSSPLVIDGHIYLHLQNQRFTCIDLASGETTWTSEPFGKYWSLVANGNRILALDETGELLLMGANPKEFELIDRVRISEQPTWAHLAVCGNEIFVRELNALVAWRWNGNDANESRDRK